MNAERLYGKKPELLNCTNAWISGKGLDDIRTPVMNRRLEGKSDGAVNETLNGTSDPKLFYNCFLLINGVEDKLTYLNELYQFGQELKAAGRPRDRKWQDSAAIPGGNRRNPKAELQKYR